MMNSPTETIESLDDPPVTDPSELPANGHLQLFATLVTVNILSSCDALHRDWISHAKRLISRVMEGLSLEEDFTPKLKKGRKVSRAVVAELREAFGSRAAVTSMLVQMCPLLDEALSHSIREHIVELARRFPEKQAKKRSRQQLWTAVKEVSMFVGAVLLGLVAIMLIP
ncbi:uncharacterized protein ACNS7B_022750 [Menidia menidia]